MIRGDGWGEVDARRSSGPCAACHADRRRGGARAFYADLLGIPEQVKRPHLAKRGGCWFEHGTLKVHLGVEQDFRPARKAHPAFIVEDLSALARVLSAAGFELRTDAPLEGYDRVFVDDPFGNRIELMEPKSG
jgi:catechol 2,3-dioxygenase-like lactoylglutathione lyase family enzyme